MTTIVGAGVPRRSLTGVLGAPLELAASLWLDTGLASGVIQRFGAGALTRLLHETDPLKVPQFPTYCVLLYSDVPGAQAEVDRYVTDNPAFLDALSGDECVVMVIESRSKRTRKGTRGFSSQEVLTLARRFGLEPSSLPAAVFFSSWPDRTTDCVRVGLGEMLSEVGGDARAERLTKVFEQLFAAASRAAGLPEKERKARLVSELKKATKPFLIRRRPRGVTAIVRIGRVVRTGAAVASAVAGIGSAEHTLRHVFVPDHGSPPPPAHVKSPPRHGP